MELKVVCHCGQKYKFDVEPVNGQLPFAVNCPICGVEGTQLANQVLFQNFPQPPAPPSTSGLRVNTPAPVAVAAPPLISAAVPVATPAHVPVARAPKAAGEFNMGLGILGAFLGAALGGGLMYAFYTWADFRFPLMGTGIGALSGLGARTLFKGTSSTLGAITAGIALCATAGTLFFIYGGFAVTFVITMGVSAYAAWRIAG
jgi:hypothetical protein